MAPLPKWAPPAGSLDGKVAVVTGANTGIGKATAETLAAAGCRVVLACRSLARGEAAAKDVGGGAYALELDLGSVASVKAFAASLASLEPRVDILVCNGGLQTMADYSGPKVTEEGYEVCFGVNYLAHVFLQCLMWPLLEAAAAASGTPARVVMVASITTFYASNKFANYVKGPAKTQGNYAASKLACTVWAQQAAQKLGDGATVELMVADPGGVASDVWRNYNYFQRKFFETTLLTRTQGCRTSVAAATGAKYKPGSYLWPFTFKPAKYVNMLGKNFYYCMPFISQPFYGVTTDKAAPKSYKKDSSAALMEITLKECAAHGITVPAKIAA